MEPVAAAEVSLTTGVAGDARGQRLPNGTGKRQVALIAREDWEAACVEAGCDLDWLESRRNLLVEGLTVAHTTGGRIRIGAAVMEITGECDPCWKMDRAHMGLQAAMRRDWRGGLTCRVLAEGSIAIGDSVILESD